MNYSKLLYKHKNNPITKEHKYLKSIKTGTLFFLVFILLSCHAPNQATIQINNHKFTVEIADTPDLRQKGLMFRENLDSNHGMLFVFGDEQPRSFWMKNTVLPLDLAFVATSGRILSIKQGTPYSLTPIPSDFPARYVLEVEQGTFSRLGIITGDLLIIKE